jgi:thiol-disulfide isomerase/thioredoxin
MSRAFAQFIARRLFALRKVALGLAVALLALVGCSPEPTPPSADAPSALELVDLEARPVDPFAAGQPVVFLFLRTDCPVSNRYAPEIRRLRDEFSAKGIGFWMVYPDPDEATADIRRQLSEYQLTGPVLRDPKTALARLGQVGVTPEAAVFNARRELVYHGRIDDRFVVFGVNRPEATRHDLAEVLDSIVAGRPVTNAPTRSVGCAITFVP